MNPRSVDPLEKTKDTRWRRWLARGDRQERRTHRLQIAAAVLVFGALGLRLLSELMAG